MRAGRRVVAVVVCAALVLPGPAAARAQEPEASAQDEPPAEVGASDQAEALSHFREGSRLYKERRFHEAAEAFARSLAAVWSINAAYNMSLALDRSGDVAAAYAAYHGYLERAAADDQHRATAQARSEQLRAQLGEVLLQLDSPEAIREIRINGVVVARDAFPRLMVPGPLAVQFIGEAAGQVQEVRAEVRAGGTATIVFPGFPRREVVPEPRPEPRPAEPPPNLRRQRALRAGFWTGLGLTATSGALIGVFGALTLDYEWRREHLKESCGVPCDPAVPAAWQRKFDGYHAATNAMIGVTVALGIAAIALGVVALRERPRRSAATRARLRWFGPAAELTF